MDTLLELLPNASSRDIEVIKTENLYKFDGKQAYPLGQGK